MTTVSGPARILACAVIVSIVMAASAWAQAGPPEVMVAVPLASRVAQWDEFTGRFEAMERVEVRPRVSGYIDQVHFRDGSIVNQGDLLFTIDQRPFQLAVDSAQADVIRTKAQVVLDEADYERALQLVKTAATPVRELDQRKANLDIARAQVMAAEAALHTAQLNLEWSEVRAPIGGRVSDRRVDPGNLVAGGQNGATLLTTIVKLDPIYFVFDGSEADYIRYSRLSVDGQRGSSRDTPNPVQGAARRRNRLAAQRRDEFRRQRNQCAFRHDPRPGDLRQQGPFPDAGHVRTPAPLWRAARCAADPGRRGGVRPGAQGRADRRRGQQGGRAGRSLSAAWRAGCASSPRA